MNPHDAARKALDAVPSLPRDDDGPVFAEPWQAQAFAMTLALHEAGRFSWPEWVEIFTDEINKAQSAGDPDFGDTYYHHWLAALERIVAEKGIATEDMLDHVKSAWDDAAKRTPHGAPIHLAAGIVETVRNS